MTTKGSPMLLYICCKTNKKCGYPFLKRIYDLWLMVTPARSSFHWEEEQIDALDVHGEIADLVDDAHLALVQDLAFARQAVLKMSVFQIFRVLSMVNSVIRCLIISG